MKKRVFRELYYGNQEVTEVNKPKKGRKKKEEKTPKKRGK